MSNSTTVNLLAHIGGFPHQHMLSVVPFTVGFHGTRGIIPGMIVKDFSGATVGTVASITDFNTFELETAGSTVIGNLTFEPTNPHVSLINIQSNKVGNDIVISGNLKVRELSKNATFPIYIDSLITTHN